MKLGDLLTIHDIFFFFGFSHPKNRKSILYRFNNVGGTEQVEFKDIEESDDLSQQIPEGYSMFYIGQTHLNMIWDIGN
jgi:hypothetical protein